ncbi:hypothetical protein IWQ57_001619 [Coemansia nantahalensis]|uniref:Uncharacterized protein n=1 Tax=Coemansia nantahalensis TaxID=2789366 RepID=A0ACC1K481_9FUNG|nr:hypothetical protein IWQ57_001619 [Coemansia nantahalensis]
MESDQRWETAALGLSIASLVCAALAAGIAALACARRPELFQRPGLRLTLWIAIACAVSAAGRIPAALGPLMARQADIRQRALMWVILSADLYVAVAVTCLAVLLWGVWDSPRAPSRLRAYAGYPGLLSLVATHPIWYIGGSATWTAPLLAIDGRPLWQRAEMWPMFLLWTAMAIVASGAAISWVFVRIWRELRGTVPPPPRRLTRGLLARVAGFLGYVVLLLLTQGWPVLQALANRRWLLRAANTAPAAQGVLCLVAMAAGPHAANLWSAFGARPTPAASAAHEEAAVGGPEVAAIAASSSRREETATSSSSSGSPTGSAASNRGTEKSLRLDFADHDASTINLSPYQSRANSIS